MPPPHEIEESLELCIRRYQRNRRSERLAAEITERLAALLSHPDADEEIPCWKLCQYRRMAKRWRWIASGRGGSDRL